MESGQEIKINHKEGYKSIVDTYILTIVLGVTGAHHFYLGRPWFLFAYFVSFGLLGVGWFLDILRVPWLVKEANDRISNPSLENHKHLRDAYILWFPCGIFGFHLFYLRRPFLGVLYFFTFGMFGFGWIMDGFRMPSMVREENEKPFGETERTKHTPVAYCFALSPVGLFGAHYYYLNQPWWGILYTFTTGLFGWGWIVDWFRCYFLVERARLIKTKQIHPNTKFLDDIALLWFPFGIFGLHHFYLGRHGWGLLYFSTLGLLGIGWFVDLFRLNSFINDHNMRINSCLINGKGSRNYTDAAKETPEDHLYNDSGNYQHNHNGILPPSYEEATRTK
ncbi:hypothetical protein LOTGIDRAFT_159102 [Lottia gigantea]|uniref:TM2 domain-containing protein n=1 Tax=Lottia gigantea TaxID=225164 RepID=V4AMC0_LOTGI|nr:hypothetical protein LOTGIDRAFT_159102 [Lottia gigantea]ESO98302.1 hypothetical protein LOTGIDRAFT_159102 [Lottia gigantea]